MLFPLTIFLSAFLLFQVQLICAKQLLPWFGGVPAVWTTCQMFFQVLLLGGYAYAHVLTRVCRPRWQGIVHLSLLTLAVVGVAALAVWSGAPLLAPAALKPTDAGSPIRQLLLILATTVGLPFFVLSATGPLLQRWHSYSTDSLGKTYRLYALSNLGSLLGLISYPLGIERWLDLEYQGWVGAILFVIFAGSCGAIAARARNHQADSSKETITEPGALEENTTTNGRRRLQPWLWLLLTFSSSAMFLSTTNQLCIEVAVVPFLWALPLAIYLLTFIICFDRPKWYSRRWLFIGAVITGLMALMISRVVALHVFKLVLVYCAFLACFCMVCHGELVRLRPGSSRLTLYYLVMATGGALGGVFVSIGAPFLFSGVWEFHLTIILGWITFGAVWILDDTSPLRKGDRAIFALATFLLGLVAAPFVLVRTPLARMGLVVHNPYLFVLLCAVILAGGACAIFWRSPTARLPFWPQALVLVMILAGGTILGGNFRASHRNAEFAARNFYGVVRVTTLKTLLGETRGYMLMHGLITHGLQFTDPALSQVPTTYFSPSSGLGVAARHLLARSSDSGGSLNLGIVGLGAGTIAAYARPGDQVKFYEIDPIVIAMAGQNSPYFSFLRDCPGQVEIAPGDARLVLEREALDSHSERFDLLAEDAFSGDSIPMHLLTIEAFQLYAARLRNADSILAVHISNSFLDLEPVIAANARQLGFRGLVIDSPGDSPQPEPSTWILLARNPRVFDDPLFAEARPRALTEKNTLFTDRYSNLFRVLK